MTAPLAERPALKPSPKPVTRTRDHGMAPPTSPNQVPGAVSAGYFGRVTGTFAVERTTRGLCVCVCGGVGGVGGAAGSRRAGMRCLIATGSHTPFRRTHKHTHTHYSSGAAAEKGSKPDNEPCVDDWLSGLAPKKKKKDETHTHPRRRGEWESNEKKRVCP